MVSTNLDSIVTWSLNKWILQSARGSDNQPIPLLSDAGDGAGFENHVLSERGKVTPQPRRGTRDTKGKRMEMSLMKPAKLTLVRPLSALVVRLVPFCGYA
jgi:hypothetical protein